MGGPLPDPSKPKPPSCDGEEGWCQPVVPIAPPSPYAPPPPPLASHGRRTFVTALIISGSVLAFLTICISVFFFVRRRRLRRRREALLEAALVAQAAAPGAFPDDGDGPGGEVVHHAWHIRTVGLDEAAIESIALAPYRAGGALGASDCTVCLGEFQDGELLRLLPKCAHAFHVQCIDTWLRAHVSCPLCRADVVGAAAEQPDDDPARLVSVAGASAQQSASNGAVEQEQPDQRGNTEQQDLRVHVQSDRPDHSGSPERPHLHTGAPAQNFRRVASMDSPLPAAAASAEEALPEHDHAADGEKPGTGGAVCCEASPAGSGHLMSRPAMKRSLSAGSRWRWTSRHCRARSSLLPF